MEEEKKQPKQGRYIALGVALGMLMGVAWDNIPIGLAFGLAVGAALECWNGRKRNKEEEKNNQDTK